ncbi:hypothetical protein [Nitrolancea hollandica]|uniref:Uncharacterized protein n=1 Tax=Nitrolancea hollandica Lb TaxID=1129897 RepID=I4EHH1_9BACT|nr:hypothetical protein [Nitrolancea hollandica]CCF84133.1 hypothetical protein NITHO_3110006 [Nitrolancea hollandica Lb]
MTITQLDRITRELSEEALIGIAAGLVDKHGQPLMGALVSFLGAEHARRRGEEIPAGVATAVDIQRELASLPARELDAIMGGLLLAQAAAPTDTAAVFYGAVMALAGQERQVRQTLN